MTPDQIREEIARLEPEAAKLLTQSSISNAAYRADVDRWHAVYERIHALKSALSVLDDTNP
jgi:hypothetical protein